MWHIFQECEISRNCKDFVLNSMLSESIHIHNMNIETCCLTGTKEHHFKFVIQICYTVSSMSSSYKAWQLLSKSICIYAQ